MLLFEVKIWIKICLTDCTSEPQVEFIEKMIVTLSRILGTSHKYVHFYDSIGTILSCGEVQNQSHNKFYEKKFGCKTLLRILRRSS